jgi:triosephosphate isomerase
MVKKIVYVLLTLLIVIQLFRPTKNIATAEQTQSIDKAYIVPQNVNGILKKACYDCHSNTTVYPWYVNIQPVAWWMDDHIKEGKRKLNFSEFGTYTLKKQDHKLEEVTEQIVDEMPLKSYKIAHSEARLTPEEKKALTDWANTLRKEIQNKM